MKRWIYGRQNQIKIKGSGEWWIFINHDGKRKAKLIGENKHLAKEQGGTIAQRIIL